MKALHLVALVMVVALVGIATPAMAATDMNGGHYNLNVIGVTKDKNPDALGWTNENRHTIFVPLDKKVNIYMTQGDDFAVLDADGTDGSATFQLGPGYYEVYATALGKPNGYVTIIPEATFDAYDYTTDFYLGSVTLEHSKKPTRERVTGLFIADVVLYDEYGNVVNSYNNEWIFNIPEFLEYWWNYDNNGCKLLQVRLYPVDEQPVVENL
jgi:hypothetical protein